MKKFIKILLFTILFTAVVALGGVCYYFVATADVEFEEDKLKKACLSCEIYDRNGQEIELPLNYEYVEFDSIPVCVKNAFIAIEDRRFYSHKGIDYKSLARALKNNLLSLSAKEGGSTISQQLIKNTFLSGEKTIQRKMKEFKLTSILEKKYSKDQILEMYLNTVYFGEGAYGIESAAKKYFGVKTEKLSVCQAATLAGIIKAPSYYDPYINPEKAVLRRNTVIDKMAEENYIDDNTATKIKEEEINLNYSQTKNRDYTCDMVIDEALSILKKDTVSDLKSYKIYTKLEQTMSDIIPTAADYNLDCNYSAIVIDNKTKQIVACKSDVGNVKRCPASAAKPWLVYAPAIEKRYVTQATKIDDTETDFNGYKPVNYGGRYNGLTSVKDCLIKSLNVPAVKIVNGMGVDEIISYSRKMGIDFENDDLSIALGNLVGGITLTDLAGAYLPFSCDGLYSKPQFIEKITDKNGRTVYRKNNEEKRIFSNETAFLINDMLKYTATDGTTKKLSSLGFSVCSKTGTNGDDNGNTDAYCVAYTPDYTVAVWLGNRDFSVMTNKISGGSYPTAMVGDILKDLYKGTMPTEFTKPQDIISVYIDKKAYSDDGKALIAREQKDGILFNFVKGTEPKKYAEKEIMPNVKSYKITNNNGKIAIQVVCDSNIMYFILNEKSEVMYNSAEENDCFEFYAKDGVEYNFYLLPYLKDGDKIIEGEKIKLPSVKTEGSSDFIKEIPWWEED